MFRRENRNASCCATTKKLHRQRMNVVRVLIEVNYEIYTTIVIYEVRFTMYELATLNL